MNLKEIREECWDIARETGATDNQRLWTTKEMNRYINRVYRFIARETRCIRDDITESICRIPIAPPVSLVALQVAAATDAYAAQDLVWYNSTDSWLSGKLVAPYSFSLNPLILQIDEVKYTIKQWKLTRVSSVKWQTNPWWEQVVGMATEYSTDLANNRINVNFRCTDSDTLKLVVRRLPVVDLSDDADIPEIRTDYHDFMKNGVLEQMYSKQDSQTLDTVKALNFYAQYMKDIDEIKQRESILNYRLQPNYSMDGFR